MPGKKKIRNVLRYLRKKNFARNTRHLVKFLGERYGWDATLLACEVGVERGRTTEALLECFPRITLYGVDAWREFEGDVMGLGQAQHIAHRNEASLRTYRFGERITFYNGCSQSVADMFAMGIFDLLYLDADHKYENVAIDLRIWWPKVKSGGCFCGDDYDGKGDHRKNPAMRFGVKRAVDEFADERGLEVGRGEGNLFYFDVP